MWTPQHRGLAVGLVLTITMLAFEALGVSTAMPIVAEELDGVGLYGWTFTAALLGSLVGISVAGARVDRHGPGRPFLGGLALFSAGVVAAGSAPTMEWLVAARFVQGLGIGVVPAVVYASIGRAFGERARARMFALLSSAWVVPGLVGPAVAGTIAESVGWRWVFYGVLPFAVVNAFLAAPALVRLGPPPAVEAEAEPNAAGTVRFAIMLAAGAALIVGGLNTATLLSLAFAAAGVAIAVRPLRRLLPVGTFVAANGIPAAVATRGAQTAAFFTGQAFLPLALTELLNQSATIAGLALTTSTLTWTAGAWLQERRGHTWGRRVMVRRGIAILVGGLVATSSIVVPGVPAIVGAVAWSVAGLGMGMAYGGLSLVVLSSAAAGEEGRASSALQLSEVFSVALGTGLAGAAVAAADRAGELRPGLAAAFGLAVLSALLATRTSVGLPAAAEGQMSASNVS